MYSVVAKHFSQRLPASLWLNNLGNNLQRRFNRDLSSEDEISASHAFRSAYDSASASPLQRLRAAKALVAIFKRQERWLDAAQFAESAVKLLPSMLSHGLKIQDQQEVASNFAGLAADACSLCLKTRDDMKTNTTNALELLEAGRGAIVGLILDSNTDIIDLRAHNPDLARRFEHLQFELNNLSDDSLSDSRSTYKINQERDECIHLIRKLPGYDRFLLAPSIREVQRVMSDGSIILINISNIRSDAIIVSKAAVKSVHLLDLSFTKATEWAKKRLTYSTLNENVSDWGKRNKEYRSFLSWLWKSCVNPALSALECRSKEAPQRVWWIGTGLASSMPFHAAGCGHSSCPASAYCGSHKTA